MNAMKPAEITNRKEKPAIAIELTADQYRLLLELAYCGNWLINSWREDQQVLGEFDNLENHLLTYAAKAGLPEVAETDQETKQMFFSGPFEQAVHERFVPDYENDVFWGELCQRLAWRDLERSFGSVGIGRMGSRERTAALERIEDRYQAEFDQHGVDNLALMDANSEGRAGGSGLGPIARKPAEA
jgi:hypothetical protein